MTHTHARESPHGSMIAKLSLTCLRRPLARLVVREYLPRLQVSPGREALE